MRIISGPAVIGNCFGSYGTPLEAGEWAIVRDCEYSNGGSGPATVNGKAYGSKERAERAMTELQTKPE